MWSGMTRTAAALSRMTGGPLSKNLSAMLAMVMAFGASVLGTRQPDPIAADGAAATARQAGTVISVVVIGIVALVGVLIFANVSEALPDNHSLSSTQTAITDGFGNALDLVPIILIVLLASVVVAVVNRMRGG
jgi:uncharacterized membrane protein